MFDMVVVRFNLNQHRTAVPIDHPNGSITADKLANGAVGDGKLATNTVTVMIEALIYG